MLSKTNQQTKDLYDKGYRVNIEGTVISPLNKKLSKHVIKSFNKNHVDNRYMFVTHIKGEYYKVPVAKFQAYQKYGSKLFKPNVVIRHKDGNSLNDNSENILIGSQSDNMNDRDPEIRHRHACHAAFFNQRDDWDRIDIDRNSGMSYDDLSIKYNISKGTLSYRYKGSNIPVTTLYKLHAYEADNRKQRIAAIEYECELRFK